MLVGIREPRTLASDPRRLQRLPEPPLRPLRSRRRAESGPRRCGPSRSDRGHPALRQHLGACPIIKIFGPGCRSGRIPFDSLMEDHMKYMLLIYNEEKAWGKFTEAQRQGFMGEFMKFTQQLQSAGQWLSSSQLQPTSAATSVRVRDAKRLVTDGPFAETREQLGGYYLFDASDLDEPILIPERIPPGRLGTVEIRPVLEIGGLPKD